MTAEMAAEMNSIKPGFYVLEGTDEIDGPVMVNQVGTSLTVWGWSHWGPEGEEPTWAYRTLGMSLEAVCEMYPQVVFLPDRDRQRTQ